MAAPHRDHALGLDPFRATRTWRERGRTTPTRTDELWVANFSRSWALAAFVYVTFVVDVSSR